jgi:hypothetical protein
LENPAGLIVTASHLLCGLIALTVCASARDAADNLVTGRQLAQQVCGSCHIFPEPDIADRFTWANAILPRMNDWLGYHTVDWTNEPGGDKIIASGRLPLAPIIDLESVKNIHNYYLRTAPLRPLPQLDKLEVKIGLKHFRIRKSPHRTGDPATTVVKIDESSRSLFVGDAHTKKVTALRPNGTVAGTFHMPNPIVHLLERSDGFYASLIGSVTPSDLAEGQFMALRNPLTNPAQNVLLSGLRRPVAAAIADLNGDGRDDLVIASFGNILGRFSWYEQKSDQSYEEHVLLDRPGAVGVKVHDFNKDQRPDIVVLMAQAQEGISVFLNRGEERFEEKIIAQKHPAWGFSHLELADLNKDGNSDLLVTNGDNGDNITFPHCVKPYHGVRIYLNDGTGNFREGWFYPLYGAYRALARDFDLDGDLDIAAIAFFPDYFATAAESFTYLENQGAMTFAPSTFIQSISGRWITMDAGDLDGDGDTDIVLGASNRSFGDVPATLARDWREKGPSILLLDNTSR